MRKTHHLDYFLLGAKQGQGPEQKQVLNSKQKKMDSIQLLDGFRSQGVADPIKL